MQSTPFHRPAAERDPVSAPDHDRRAPRHRTMRSSRLRSLVREPATRSSLALMVSAVGTGLLTFVFWSLVARRDGAQAVGAASAELSAVTFLAGVGSLNMINVFARFLPEAGSYSRRFVVTGYSAALVAGTVVGLVFLATPLADGLVVGGRGGRLAFLLLVVAVSVFMIQDGGLIGLGRASLVPVENVLVALGRICALLVGAAVVSGAGWVVVAWAVPVLASVVVVNTLVVVRWTPGDRTRHPRLPPRRELRRFVAVESVTTAVSSSVSAFLPAVVSRVMGTVAAGYFYVPWLIASTAGLLLSSILISMVRESVARPLEAWTVLRRSLRLCAFFVVAGSVGCTLLGRPVLRLVGPGFAEGSGRLLTYIGLSIPATAVGMLFWSLCLIRRRAWPVFAVNVATTVLVLGGVLVLGRGSVDRVGMLYCGVQWLIALAVVGPVVRALRETARQG